MRSPETMKVTCVMVTRNRVDLARRAVHCFARQTWPHKELLILDDGDIDYTPMLRSFPAQAIRYLRMAPRDDMKLGGLRNLALDNAEGDIICQWDDDEWYHPERVEKQLKALIAHNALAVFLKWTLMHIDDGNLATRLFRCDSGFATPGTVMHRRTHVRYPNLPRAEDSLFMRRLSAAGDVRALSEDSAHLFIRCFHGNNTWNAAHFLKRLRRTPHGLFAMLRLKLTGAPLTRHPAFQLTDDQRRAETEYFADSQRLGIVRSTQERLFVVPSRG